MKLLSHVQLFATPWTVAHQAPLFLGFSRQEYWSGLPFPSPGDLPDPGIEPGSPVLQADTSPSEPPGKKYLPLFTREERQSVQKMVLGEQDGFMRKPEIEHSLTTLLFFRH